MALPEVGSGPYNFSLPNQYEKTVGLSDYAGKNVLIWFFPRAFGGGRTKEAQGFRDRTQEFKDKNTELLGITFSLPADLKKWIGDTGLTTDLLYDADRTVAMAYGAAESSDQERATRLSVLIGPDGRVIKIYAKPDPATHPTEVLNDLD